MTFAAITLSSKGQVVIPKELRDEVHWEPGTQLALISTPSSVTIKAMPQKTGHLMEDLIGMLKHEGRPLSTDGLCKPVDYFVASPDWRTRRKHRRVTPCRSQTCRLCSDATRGRPLSRY